jgi:hypothetical protein
MPKVRNNAEVLRALGHFLDEQGATTFEIVNYVAYLAVTWGMPPGGSLSGQRAYQEHDLRSLRAEARAMRQGSEGPVGSLVELLRTIGQELDREGLEVSSVRRNERAFYVSTASGGRHRQYQYRTKDLVAIAAARRAMRGRPLPAPPSEQTDDIRDPFIGVVIGARVYTEDGALIGQVLDIRSRYFKIAATPRDEGCWLPAESVGSVTRAGDVLLSPISSETDKLP